MRSKLFVPGVRPELFAKALAGAADAISIDLEDAVPEAGKSAAREAAAAFVTSDPARQAAKLLIVRINALGTPHFEADVQALVRPGTALLINLPKPETAAQVRVAVQALERAEAAAGVSPPIRLLLNIETPRALRHAAEIAGAHPRVAGLQLGLGDLFEPHGIQRRDPANVHAVMFALRLAAAEAGVFAVDGAFGDVQDAEGYRAEALMARRLGFIGKSCIHPSQVALANAVFAADADELAQARRIVEAARAAAAQGRGAFIVDGRMIDLPFLKRAEAIVAQAQVQGDPP
jgi:citrate lyase subunit beta/citryl-CoA lyase